MMTGRPVRSPDRTVRVGKFALNAADPVEKRLAKFLLHAPKGARTSRMLDLIVDGYRHHLEQTGTALNEKKASKTSRIEHIDDVPFDMAVVEQACCYAYINAAKWRARRQRVIALLRAGFEKFEISELGGRGV